MMYFNRIVKQFIPAIFTLMLVGCEETNNLGDKFIVTYVDNPNYRNVYYERQGIFGDFTVIEVIYNDEIILVKGYRHTEPNEPDSSRPEYYSIDKALYIKDPWQMESKGVNGPFSKTTYDSLEPTMDAPEKLTW